MGRTTLKDIAKALNTTIATVSRALHDSPEISDSMKEKVREVARVFNYNPNHTALSLKYKKSYRLGVIFPKLAHYYVTQVLSGILEEARKAGYKILIAESNYDDQKELDYIKEFYDLNVDGILILPSRKLAARKQELENLIHNDVPFLIMDRLIYFDNIHTSLLSSNDYVGAREGVTHLIEQGYKRIVHLKGLDSSNLAKTRFKGYLDSLTLNGIDVNEDLIVHCNDFTQEEGKKIAIQLMRRQVKPDAFFCINDILAVGVLKGLREIGVKVPTDVGVLGFSNSDLAEVCVPSLSSVHQPGKKIGRKGVKLILSSINDGADIRKKNIVMKTKLVVRESTNRQNLVE